MSNDLTPLEAVRVAAFGMDRPERVGGEQNGAKGEVSTPGGLVVSPGRDNGLDRLTAEQLAWLAKQWAWLASWWSGWCTDNDQTLPELAELGGFLIDVKRVLLGVSDAAS